MTNLLSIIFNSDNATGTAVYAVCQSQMFRENNFLLADNTYWLSWHGTRMITIVNTFEVNNPLVWHESCFDRMLSVSVL